MSLGAPLEVPYYVLARKTPLPLTYGTFGVLELPAHKDLHDG